MAKSTIHLALRTAPGTRPLMSTTVERLDGLTLADDDHDLDKLDAVLDELRPKCRAECLHAERPCLFVSCKHHLYLDVNPETGSLKLNFPDKEPWEMKETCSLDVADKGGVTLEEVGEILNLTRERIRQVEVKGLRKLRHQSRRKDLIDFLE